MKPKVFVDGEHGTTGLQIHERLKIRDDIELLSVAHQDRRDVSVRRELLNEADFAILCLPDEASREAVIMVEDNSTRFIDASTAHRTHPQWTYGFIELDPNHGEKIAASRLVSNPGCYPTGAIALLRPLTQAGILAKDALVCINAISGYSGGGKNLIAQMEDPSRGDAISSPHFLYATQLDHKHLPEIAEYSELENAPIFTPSVGNFPQGMIVQIPFHLAAIKAQSPLTVHVALKRHYEGSSHVRVASMAECAAIDRIDAASLAGTDGMDIYVLGNDEQINLVAVLDNLGKGASGACVQSLDLMLKTGP